jgi:hypothetical protein
MDIVEELNDAQEWMRKPDWESAFTHDDIMRWLNERPTHILPKASAEIARLRSELEAVKREAVEVMKLFMAREGRSDDIPDVYRYLTGGHLRAARAFVEKYGRDG